MKRKKANTSDDLESPVKIKRRKSNVESVNLDTLRSTLARGKGDLKENKAESLKTSRKKKAKNGDIADIGTVIQTISATKRSKTKIEQTETLEIPQKPPAVSKRGRKLIAAPITNKETVGSAKELRTRLVKSKDINTISGDVKASSKKKLKKIKSENGRSLIHSEIDVINGEIQDVQNEALVMNYHESTNSEESDLENYYINKNAEKEAKEKKSIRKDLLASWPKEDQTILIERIQDCLPVNDTLSYRCRLSKLEWDKVPFKNHTLEDCQKVWTQLEKKVRHYRLFIEVIQDVKNLIDSTDLATCKGQKNNNKRHPDMPKRPLSSYFLFYLRKKDKISKEHPNCDVIELNRLVSEKYHNLPPKKKEKYKQIAAKNKEEYKKKLDEFFLAHPEIPRKVTINKKRKLVKEKPPKRPENPYKQFVLSELSREKIEDHDKSEFKEVCKEKWRQMSDKKKILWISLAEKQFENYQEELREYMSRHPEYRLKSAAKPFLSKKEVNLKDKLAGKPKKPPANPYSLFVGDVLQSEEISNIPAKERMNYTSAKWKSMSERDKEQYKTLFVQVNDQYEKDFKAYLDSLPEDKRQAEILLNMPKKKKINIGKPSTSKIQKPKSASKAQKTTSKVTKKKKLIEPVQPPRSPYKYFADKYEGDNPNDAWKKLSQEERERYDKELIRLKEIYIRDFEQYLKSLTKEELEVFSTTRTLLGNDGSSDDPESNEEGSSEGASESGSGED